MGCELVGFLVFDGGFGELVVACECFGKGEVGFGVGGVGGYGCLELGDGFGELVALEEEAATIEGEVGALSADGDAAEVGGDLAFGSGLGSIALLGEEGRKRDVGAGLIRQ